MIYIIVAVLFFVAGYATSEVAEWVWLSWQARRDLWHMSAKINIEGRYDWIVYNPACPELIRTGTVVDLVTAELEARAALREVEAIWVAAKQPEIPIGDTP